MKKICAKYRTNINSFYSQFYGALFIKKNKGGGCKFYFNKGFVYNKHLNKVK